jgi:hypothetical protein
MQDYKFSSGAWIINGISKIGNSGLTVPIMGTTPTVGLTTSGITFNENSTMDWQPTSVINNSGNFTTHANMTITNTTCGLYTQTGAGIFTTNNTTHKFYRFHNNNLAATTTLAGNFKSELLNIANGTFDESIYDCTLDGIATTVTNTTTLVTFVNHGLPVGTAVYFPTTNVISSASVGTVYYVSAQTYSADSFRLSGTYAAALAGTSANLATHTSPIDMCVISLHMEVATGPTAVFKMGTTTPISVTGVSWSRSGTVATVTSNAHGLYYGEPVTVSNSSSTDAITDVEKKLQYDSGTNANEFKFTCNDDGDVDGTLDYTYPGAGLTCFGILCPTNVGSAMDIATNSRISNSGILAIGNAAIWKTAATGIYRQTGSGPGSTINANGFLPRSLVILPNVSITQTNDFVCGIYSSTSQTYAQYGTVISGTNSFICGSVGGFYFGANADIIGSNVFTNLQGQPFPISDWARTTAISYTGAIRYIGAYAALASTVSRYVLAADLSNSSLQIFASVSGSVTSIATFYTQPSTGGGNTFKLKSLYANGVSSTGTGTVSYVTQIFDNSLGNCNFQISDIIDLGGAYSYSHSARWAKVGSTIQVAHYNIGTKVASEIGVYTSDNKNALPLAIYPNATNTNSSTLNWTKANVSDTFITVQETNTPVSAGTPLRIASTSVTAVVALDSIYRVQSKDTNTFTLDISVNCTWERRGTVMYVHCPRAHGLAGTNSVYVTACSDINVLPSGQQHTIVTATGTQITFTCNDTGASSGTLTWVAINLGALTLSYRYYSFPASDSTGSGSVGNAMVKGPTYWKKGTGTITLTGAGQNIFPSAAGTFSFYQRSGTTITVTNVNVNPTGTIKSPHGLIAGDIVTNLTTGHIELPAGNYIVQTVPDEYTYTLIGVDAGPAPTTTTGCYRANSGSSLLTVPATAHGLSNLDTVYIGYITDQLLIAVTSFVSKAATTAVTGANAWTTSCNATASGLVTDITVAWYRGANIIKNASFAKENLEIYLKTEDIIVDGIVGTDKIYSDFACDSFSTTVADTIQSDTTGVQRNIYAEGTGTAIAGTSFKDISMGSAGRVNAKSGCNNLGNNKGIVFKDIGRTF